MDVSQITDLFLSNSARVTTRIVKVTSAELRTSFEERRQVDVSI